MSALSEISSLADYLTNFASTLSRKAIRSLHPLHVPGRDPLPDFTYVEEFNPHRMPYEAQGHVVAASVKMLDAQGAGFIVGEPGCGKTITSALSIHEHAKRSIRKGGSNGKYRAFVLCPDTLISKWKREIEMTIPGAVVVTFDRWWDFLALAHEGRNHLKSIQGDEPTSPPKTCWVSTGPDTAEEVPVKRSDGRIIQEQRRWSTPRGAEWYIMGRDQIKRQSQSSSLGLERLCFDGRIRSGGPRVMREIDRKPAVDANGNKETDNFGRAIEKGVYDKVLICPRCGATPNKKGVPLTPASLGGAKGLNQNNCQALVFQELGAEDGKCLGLDRMVARDSKDPKQNIVPLELRNAKNGSIVNHAGKKWLVLTCGEPLWQYTDKPYWWPPAAIIQRIARQFAEYLVVDEAHQQKSDTSAQSMAMGKVLGSTKYCLALTGTFIGGYANHLFPLLMRMAPSDMKARGFEWGGGMKFTERYGCIDRIERSSTSVETTKEKGSRSMRRVKLGDVSVERKARPGIMPTLFSQIVMQLAMFLKLEQFIDGLPDFEEKMVACDLPPEIQAAYERAQRELVEANADLLINGNMKLMGTMLWTLLSYPDHPWGWEPMFHGEDGQEPSHAVGWWELPKVYTLENFRGVTSPQNFDPDALILPKERTLIDLCKKHQEMGDQTWVFCETTQKRNVMPRLAKLLEDNGLKVGILRSGDVEVREREEWIYKNGYMFDVMLSHPELVATGMDLFHPDGNHNFNHLVFCQTGYNLFRLRQASRRAWRIGQPKDCTVTYLYYSGTSQATTLALMGRKAQAAMKLEEGEVSDEGLAAMGGSDGDAALVKALSEHVDPAEIQRNWSRVKSGGRKRATQETGGAGTPIRPGHLHLPVPNSLYEHERIPAPGLPSPLDTLPIQAQIVGETMMRVVNEAPSMEEAIDDFNNWLSSIKPKEKPSVKVFEPETEEENPEGQEEPKPTAQELSRQKLANLFEAMRSGELDGDNDDWDWDS